MVMRLDKVVPFGRSLDEYQCMFDLSESDLARRILGVGDGPASFNAEMLQKGLRVVSIDPLYKYSAEEIESQFQKCVDTVIDQVKATPANWVWSYHRSADDLRAARVRVMQRFAEDFAGGRRGGRYVAGELPRLPFAEASFDLALCSHFLFLYSETFDLRFHLESVAEILRVAREVRIFPLLTLLQETSPHLQPLIGELERRGFSCELRCVPYELQPGGNTMLVVRRSGP